jgi:hypothetical protein
VGHESHVLIWKQHPRISFNAHVRSGTENASKTLKSISQTHGHVFYFIRLQTTISSSWCVVNKPLSPCRPLSSHTRYTSAVVDSTTCEMAISQKMELLAQMESVLVGSVKMCEWPFCLSRLTLLRIYDLPKRLVSDHPMLHPRIICLRKGTPAFRGPCQVIRAAKM